MANQIRLYQHSARCSVALRSFLDCNPNYWCFIPQVWQEAITENIQYLRRGDGRSSHTTDPQLINTILMGAIDNQRVASYLDYVPLSPAAYAFSYRQRQDQRLFFEKFVSSSIHQLSYSSLDLYRVAIIAVCK